MKRTEQRSSAERFGLGWVAAAGVATTFLGGYWDVAWHSDIGRDRFLTSPHLLILGGMVAVVAAAVIAHVAWSGPRQWRFGLLVAGVCGVLQLVALAVDNWWHVIFGVDVILWSPPHLLLISIGWIGLVGLLVEYARSRPRALSLAIAIGGFVASTTFVLSEFDLGLPAVSMVWSAPVLGAIAGVGLVASQRASRLRWAGTIAMASAVVLRLGPMALDAVVHRSLPVPPVELLAGGLVFDLVLRRPSRVRKPSGWPLAAALVGAWLATFVAHVLWTQSVGKSWLPQAVWWRAAIFGFVAIALAAPVGHAIGRLLAGVAAGPDNPGRPAPAPRATRAWSVASGVGVLVAIVVGLGIGVTQPQVESTSVTAPTNGIERDATLTVVNGHATLVVPGSRASDFATITRYPRRRGEGLAWLGGLEWKGEHRFEGTLSARANSFSDSRHSKTVLFPRLMVSFLGRGHYWFGEPGVVNEPPQIYAARARVTSSAYRPATPLTLYELGSQPASRPAGWLGPSAYALVVFEIATALAFALAMLTREHYVARVRDVGTGQKVFDAPPVRGAWRVLSGPDDVLELMDTGAEGVVAVVRDAGATFLAPLYADLTAIVCTGGTPRSHIGIVSREYQLPCVMAATFPGGEPAEGATVEIDCSASTGVIRADG